jgi:serine/threonine-protein kinase
VAFFLATGRPVFEGSGMDLLDAHIDSMPLPPSRRSGRDLPPEFDALVLMCLAKSPAERPGDARALAALLARVPVSPAERWSDALAAQWWQRNRPSAG